MGEVTINSGTGFGEAYGAGEVVPPSRRGWLSYEVASVGFAIILLVAAVLKAYSVALQAGHEPHLTGQDGLAIAAIGLEWALAGWIFSGVAKVWARRAAIALLVVFVCVAGYRWITGEKDCGCFGPVKIHPVWAMLADSMVLIALLLSRLVVSDARSAVSYSRRRIGVALLLVGLIVTLPIAVASFSRNTNTLSNGLVCDAVTADFGEISSSQANSLYHEFVLANVSSRPIHITNKKTSCGCTSADMSKSTLNPGESVKIPVRANWGDREGPQSATVWLTTDESPNTELSLFVRANIIREVSIDPSTYDFGNLVPGPSEEEIFQLRTGPQSPGVQIGHIYSDNELVRVRTITAASDAIQRFAVNIVAPRLPAAGRATISVFTSSRTDPLLLRISYRARGAIESRPRSVAFVLHDEGIPGTARVVVRLLSSRPEYPLSVSIVPEAINQGLSARVAREGDVLNISLDCTRQRSPDKFALRYLRINNGADQLDIPVLLMSSLPEENIDQ